MMTIILLRENGSPDATCVVNEDLPLNEDLLRKLAAKAGRNLVIQKTSSFDDFMEYLRDVAKV